MPAIAPLSPAGVQWPILACSGGQEGSLAGMGMAPIPPPEWSIPAIEPPDMSPMPMRSEEHTSELQSLMRISYAVFCLKKKKNQTKHTESSHNTRHRAGLPPAATDLHNDNETQH